MSACRPQASPIVPSTIFARTGKLVNATITPMTMATVPVYVLSSFMVSRYYLGGFPLMVQGKI